MRASRPRVAVVGHVEWVQFARVPHVPRAGEVVHAREPFEEPAGGGAVAAVQLARLAGGARLMTALGGDELARRSIARLRELGVDAFQPGQRRLRDPQGGDARGRSRRAHDHHATDRAWSRAGSDEELPWAELAQMDAVYFTAGDLDALRAARAARVLVASPRAGEVLGHGVELDALVLSGEDAIERRQAERVGAEAKLGRVDGGRARWRLPRAHRRIGHVDRRARCRARRSTPTAAATPSRRGSPTGWAPGSRCRPRSRWRPAAARSA